MFTKTGLPPAEIRKILRAQDSPLVQCFYDHVTGRDKLFDSGWYFPMQVDAFGNSFLNSDGFSLDGVITWEVWAERYFWSRVAKGELGIDPRVLFRLKDAPLRTLQILAEGQASPQPVTAAPVQTSGSKPL